jgi:putative membrane protein
MQNKILNTLLPGAALFFFPLVLGAQQPGPIPSQGPLPSERPGGINDPLSRGEMNTIHNAVDDKSFAKRATVNGMIDVEMGKLAAEKGSSSEVKQFGQKMADERAKSNDQLKEIASRESIAIPDALTAKQRSHIDKLSKLSGEEFDQAYLKDQVKSQGNDVREYQMEAEDGSDAGVKNFAAQTLPSLQENLKTAKDLHQKSNSKSH